MNLTKKNIKKLKPYTCARDLYKEGIFLDANESYSQWININWKDCSGLNRYPDSTAEKLRLKLSKTYIKGFNQDNIFIGCGSDEIIDLLIRGFVDKNESIMMMNPSYSIYQVQADINNVVCKKILLKSDFSLNLKLIKKNLDKVKIIFLCSPNNPTGSLITKKEIEKILKFYQGLIVIDEAYIEFSGLKNSLINLAKKSNQIVILRTFSKAWGLAGIRLGYAVANQEIVKTLLKIKDSYNISSVSQFIGLQALDQLDQLNDKVRSINQLKDKLEADLTSLNLKIIPTQANFSLVRVKNASEVYKKLANLGIIVRDRSNLPYLENILRVSVGSEKQNKLFIQSLQKCLTKNTIKPDFDAIIFDIDGVLVDVSQSYRQAIKLTVNYLLNGSYLKNQDIEIIKQVVGFNNDWDVSYALVKLISKNIPRNKWSVKARELLPINRKDKLFRKIFDVFQTYYLGSNYYRRSPFNYPNGLIYQEKCLINTKILEKITTKGIKTGVVTGRPRKEALLALKKQSLSKYFPGKNVISLEDVKKDKPDPEGLIKIKKRLKSINPIYIGDNRSDCKAARKAKMPCIFVGNQKLGDIQINATNQLSEVLWPKNA